MFHIEINEYAMLPTYIKIKGMAKNIKSNTIDKKAAMSLKKRMMIPEKVSQVPPKAGLLSCFVNN